MRVKITVDGKSYEVEQGDNLLRACLSNGLDLPYFCWHPILGSVGSCRQCAVKSYQDDDDTEGKIVMACMESSNEGCRISIDDPEAKRFRAQIIEWLMINHPHDCAVCDEGGECHLQDMTVMTGHDSRRYRFTKSTHRNQDLGPFINHEMNRCITCYRCVRYYRDYAGGKDLDAFGVHDRMYFGRQEDGTLESPFSGNLVEVCPTGVFTDKTFKQHYTRKWDLQSTPSVCVHCSLGCNTILGERYGGLRRVLNRYNADVNGYLLCDRGRFGYGFVNSDQRISEAGVRIADGCALESIDLDVAVRRFTALIKNKESLMGIGSPRASLEANFALRQLVGTENFYSGTSDQEFELVATVVDALRLGSTLTPSLRQIESADAVLLLGEDPTASAPLLSLALRQSTRQQSILEAAKAGIPVWHDAAVRGLAQDSHGPLFIATPAATALDDIASETVRAAPDDVARLGLAVAHELDPKAPRVVKLGARLKLAKRIAAALLVAEQPLVVAGTASGSKAVIQAAAAVATALGVARAKAAAPWLFLTLPECNSMGLALLNAKPLAEVKQQPKGRGGSVIVLENNLYRRAKAEQVDALLDGKTLVVLDHVQHPTVDRARLVLPAATFAETSGTLVNNEGRAQEFHTAVMPTGAIRPSHGWLLSGLTACRPDEKHALSLEDLRAACAAEFPELASTWLSDESPTLRYAKEKVPRASFRASGRTAMHANVSVHEPTPPEDPDSALAFSMEGFRDPDAQLIPSYWAPGWNSVQALSKFQFEVGGPMRGGKPGVRLIHPREDAPPSYPDEVPAAFAAREGEWLLLPLSRVFGGEELSSMDPAIQARTSQAQCMLHEDDGLSLGLSAGDIVEIQSEVGSFSLPVVLSKNVCSGVAMVPLDTPGVGFLQLPLYASIRRVSG
ncbi:MAG: NADH-quinone oxidoreductase subunit NuoG [Planctomycetes bacterium]|nr:NADH-quinone oxidoreductase subunit NuoG [Planctomycetota bacterium]